MLLSNFLLIGAALQGTSQAQQALDQSFTNCPTRLELEQASSEFSKRVAASTIDALKEQLKQAQAELAALKAVHPSSSSPEAK